MTKLLRASTMLIYDTKALQLITSKVALKTVWTLSFHNS